MRRTSFYLSLFLLIGLFGSACDSFTGDDTSGVVNLTGLVVDDEDAGVANAFVRVQPGNLLVETDESGLYSVEVSVDSTMTISVAATKDGYRNATINVLGVAGRTITVPTLRIIPSIDLIEESGEASNVIFSSQSATQIGVTESGSEEIAAIVFQATDSTGLPLSISKAIDITFRMGEAPGGGEFIFPTTVRTDNNGEARVNLSAGTRAGVVQIVAEATVGGRTIRSLPVAITIHGGLPEQEHFTLGPAAFNFPGLTRFGVTNSVAVILGDKYGNPVRPGTAVYFTTDYGVIQGSALTNDNGQGSVTLFSAVPLPPDGLGIVTATTADENEQPVTGKTPIVFSGVPVIEVTLSGSSESPFYRNYDYRVTDPLGNPLSPGTSISVVAGGTKVKAVGSTTVGLGDTIISYPSDRDPVASDIVTGPGFTDFSFSVVEDTDSDSNEPPSVQNITIKVGGPNGSLEITFGASSVQAKTDGAVVEQLGGGSFRVVAPE
ncbi:MAG: hypothetical protein HKN13_04250 [Rhodothermales bacterium]|nr:hypothetical protein [Rhodothermales bacterium]